MKKVWNTLFARINRGVCEYIISTRVYVNITFEIELNVTFAT